VSFIYGQAIKAAAQYEQTVAKLAKQLDIPLEEAKAQLERLARETVTPSWMRPPEMRFGGEPANPGDRRTIHLNGKPKHFVHVNGRLKMRDGESPWS
jgi:hypothetical protein